MKLPVFTAQEIIKILMKMDFKEIRQRGSHRFFRHGDGRSTVVPNHPGKTVGRGLLRRIIKEIELSRKDFLELI